MISRWILINFQTNPMIIVYFLTFVHELLDSPRIMILDTDNIYGTILSKMDYARKTGLQLSFNHSYLGNDFDIVLIRPLCTVLI